MPFLVTTKRAMVLEPNSDDSRAVVRLMEKGFVQKIIDKTNRRKVCIQATSKGLKIAKKNGGRSMIS